MRTLFVSFRFLQIIGNLDNVHVSPYNFVHILDKLI